MKKQEFKEMKPVLPAGTSERLKTGSWRVLTPSIDSSKCIKCFKCVNFCPENSIKYNPSASEGGNGRMEIDFEYCKGCGVCAQECPVKAITMNKK